MEAARSFFFGPTPEQQRRKCISLIRSNGRSINREIHNLKALEKTARAKILEASKRAQKQPSQAKDAVKHARSLARELVGIRKQSARLATSQAQLRSVEMQVNEAFSVRKIQGSMKASTGIMKDVNTLVRLPELTGTMRELSQELVKAGIIEEMVDDLLPNDELMEGEDEEADAEVDKVLGEILKDKLPPSLQVPQEEITTQPETEEEQERERQQEEQTLDDLRLRLAKAQHS